MAKSERDIVAFEDHEHVLKRPALYVGSITKSDEKIPIYRDGYFFSELRSISVAYWKIIDDSQTASWGSISNTQTPNWSSIST